MAASAQDTAAITVQVLRVLRPGAVVHARLIEGALPGAVGKIRTCILHDRDVLVTHSPLWEQRVLVTPVTEAAARLPVTLGTIFLFWRQLCH